MVKLKSISTKMLGVSAIATILAVVIGGLAHYNIHRVTDAGDDVVARATPAIALGSTRVSWAQLDAIVQNGLHAGVVSGVDASSSDRRAAEVLDGLKAYLAAKPDPEQRRLVQEVALPSAEKAIKIWQEDLKPELTTVTANGEKGIGYRNQVSSPYLTPAYDVTDTLNKVAELDDAAIRARIDASADTASAAVVSMWTLAGLGAALIFGLGLLLARTIVKPLQRTVTVLEAVAGGDLTPRLEVTRSDELGAMAAALNTTLGTVHDVISQLEADAATLQETATLDSADTVAELAEMATRLNLMISLFTLERPAEASA
ncbi:MAG: HAMP domain-containing protein [Kineosporiaceae bacterium]